MERRFERRKQELIEECKVSAELFKCVQERLRGFVEPFANHLQTHLRQEFAQMYVAGLASDLKRKNIESIAYYHNRDRQPLQRFIGQMQWDHRPLLRELARQVGAALGEPDGVIVLDPSAHSKKSDDSVGVQRQWSGRKGKIDNCQVGIYMGYVSRCEQALVDERLYLPKSWANDKKRRRKCGVPSEVTFATRLESALDMLKEQGPQLPHAWVAGDDELGRSTSFRRDLRALNERYLLAVPSNTLVRDLEAEPPSYCGRGKQPLSPFVRVDRWRSSLSDDAWTRLDVRDGEKGPLAVHVVKRRVLAITERKHPESEETLVIVRRLDEDGQTIHDYYLSSAEADTLSAEFARVANAQHRIEQCIKRAKSEAGLSDYETRTWWGWHHHQTLSLLATWFLVQETQRGKKIDSGSHGSADSRCHGALALRCDGPAPRRPPRPRLPAPLATQRTRQVLPLQTTQRVSSLTCSSTTIG
jgi:SRSO17 transposase